MASTTIRISQLSSLIARIALETWDQVVHQLRENSGMSLVELHDEQDENNDHVKDVKDTLADISCRAFRVAKKTLNVMQNCDDDGTANSRIPRISEQADSAHATGYHPAASLNSLSRYNQYREGFVWSDGQKLSSRCNSTDDEFTQATDELEALLSAIAEQVLRGWERYLKLPCGWFQRNMGPTRQSSQWHLKRYVVLSQHAIDSKRQNDVFVCLPPHTDPSLISVVIHDRPGKAQGSQGLEYHHRAIDGSFEWRTIPFTGHKVAVIFVGSVLTHITGGFFRACKHRVVASLPLMENDSDQRDRMAATLFVRPRGSTLVQVPPSPCLEDIQFKRRKMTFDAWYSRVARNYEKAKPQTQTDSRRIRAYDR